ncbi:LamG-like jellyroll fold domain-containing protein [Streptomyces sp. NPDC059680]|uniref:LamG-like jellyroll fold domain-containing protein n=1 Tax=Streptomyces sp. NPDC059680 TaxID=3346904 RepID=UPI0036B08938
MRPPTLPESIPAPSSPSRPGPSSPPSPVPTPHSSFRPTPHPSARPTAPSSTTPPQPRSGQFGRHDDDSTSTSLTAACGAKAQAGKWTYLVGVYDADAGQLLLYADGRLATTKAYTGTSWNAAGPVQFGHHLYEGPYGEHVNARLVGVRRCGHGTAPGGRRGIGRHRNLRPLRLRPMHLPTAGSEVAPVPGPRRRSAPAPRPGVGAPARIARVRHLALTDTGGTSRPSRQWV